MYKACDLIQVGHFTEFVVRKKFDISHAQLMNVLLDGAEASVMVQIDWGIGEWVYFVGSGQRDFSQTGFENMFGFHVYKVVPDVMTVIHLRVARIGDESNLSVTDGF